MAPDKQTLARFNLQGNPLPLPGGEGRTYRVGGAVLKHVHNDSREYWNWIADTCNGMQTRGFRLSQPLPAADGTWITPEGWSAWTFLNGTHDYGNRIPEIIRAVSAFHEAYASVPRPHFLDADTPYMRADTYAWGTAPEHIHEDLKEMTLSLFALREPVDNVRDQIIHGDLNPGNILLSPGTAPAIIDIAPYWRPPEFALAVFAYWIGPWRNDSGVLRHFETVPHFRQMLVRAGIRMLLIMSEFSKLSDMESYRHATDMIISYCKKGGTAAFTDTIPV